MEEPDMQNAGCCARRRKGSRLEPLTRDRGKPAVLFGGCFRIIDFTLSNCPNSGLRKILVMTQYKAASLERHIELGWHFLPAELGEFVSVRPPEQRVDENWYKERPMPFTRTFIRSKKSARGIL
ncbi:MAG: sugar phosphate nucleotidyltransferase [Planctomycetaceae bacterium]